MPSLELSSSERKKLASALKKNGADDVATAALNGTCFRSVLRGICTVAAAAGGLPMVEAYSRILKEELPTWKVHLVIAGDDFHVLHQKTNNVITSLSMRRVRYVGQLPDDDKVFGVVKRDALGMLQCLFFDAHSGAHQILQEMSKVFDMLIKSANLTNYENPVDVGLQAAMKRRLSSVAAETIDQQPWFVGNADATMVEDGLAGGMVGDYVVRESRSTPGAYVLVIKLSASEFIQQKLSKNSVGTFNIDGQVQRFATISKLIESIPQAKRPAASTVLGKHTDKVDPKDIDVRVDLKAFDALYLGCQQVYERKEITPEIGKQVVKKCVADNSQARKELQAKKNAAAYEVLKKTIPSGMVHNENPVALVLTPELVRIVERASGEVLQQIFIRDIPFTLEAPGRQGGYDKFAFIIKDSALQQVECHIFNVLPGYGHLLAEAIGFYIDKAEIMFSAQEIKRKNPFAAEGDRTSAPRSLFAKQIHRADIVARDIIGAGQFGEVWLADQIKKLKDGSVTKVKRAVKLLKGAASEGDRGEFVREAETMLNFDHDNVVRLIGVAVQQSPWLTVLEFMQYGDLQKVVRSCKQKAFKLETCEQVELCRQVCAGCRYITSLRLVHMDIAARNCLVGSKNVVKLADFGLTRPMDKGVDYYRLKEKLTISIKWSAIEALKNKLFSEKSDVWSFGVCVWEVFTYGEVPYKNIPLTQTISQMSKGVRPPQPVDCDPQIWKFIQNCWNMNLDKRYTFQTAYDAIMTLAAKYPLPASPRDIGKSIREKVVDQPSLI
eukprot:m.1200197 g.1200197  ORF g.1200197 m.1200197 type:complete len:779 (-) comp24572_c0_seq34:2227-4563(-)